jgi:hypothetical protein
VKKILIQAATLAKSKRFWVCVGAIAASSTGLLPHEWVDKIAVVAVVATKVIDTWSSGGTQ